MLLANSPVAIAQMDCEAIPNRLLSRLNSIGGNRILPLPERALNQTPPGIGQLPDQTFQSIGRIGDDKELNWVFTKKEEVYYAVV